MAKKQDTKQQEAAQALSQHSTPVVAPIEKASSPIQTTAAAPAPSANLTGTIKAETLIGGKGNDKILGMGGDDFLMGGDGDDYVDGGTGNDILIGGSGAGDDTYIGGTGIDEIVYISATHSITVNLTTGKASGSDINNDTLMGIESITSGSGDDILIGDGNDNEISGGAGNDQIFGLGGSDTLSGDEGNDYIEGGDGNDSIFGGLDNDEIYGGNDADSLNGGAGNDIIHGDAGNDFIEADAGNDTIDGGSGVDQLFFGSTTLGVSVDLTTGAMSGAEIGVDTVSNIENVTGGSGNDSYRGNASDNIFQDTAGGADAYFAEFGKGNDRIIDFPSDGQDTLTLDMTSRYQDLHFVRTANNLIITDVTKSGSMTIQNYFSASGNNLIEEIHVRFVKTLELTDVQAILSNGESIPNSMVMVGPEIVPTSANVYTNHNSVLVEHEFLPGTQSFPMLANKQKLTPDSLKNGVARENLTLQNDHGVKVNFVGESSGAKNALGMYTIGANGEINDIRILTENISGTGPKSFGGGTFNAGDLVADLGTLAAGTEIGFFLVKGGMNSFKKIDQDNGTLHFEIKKTGVMGTVNDLGKDMKLIFTDGITGKEKTVGNALVHASFDNLNKDNTNHTVSGINQDGNLMIGFEEGGAKKGDFEDIVIEIAFSPASIAQPEEIPVSAGFIIADYDDNTLIHAVIEVTDGMQSGDMLSLASTLTVGAGGVISGTNITFTQSGMDMITLNGADTVAHYKMVLDAIHFKTSTILASNDTRTISFTIEDSDNLQNSATTTIHLGHPDTTPIQGSSNDDILVSTVGDDVMIGGSGNDLFVLDDAAGVDTIQDLEINHDKISVKDLLSGYDPMTDMLSDFVSVSDNGTNAELRVNATGQPGGTFAVVAILQDHAGLTFNELVGGNILVVA